MKSTSSGWNFDLKVANLTIMYGGRLLSHPLYIIIKRSLWNDNFDRPLSSFGRKKIWTCGFRQIVPYLSLLSIGGFILLHLSRFFLKILWFGRDWSTFCENHSKSALKWPSNSEKCSDCGKNRREGRPYRLLQESIWYSGISSEVWPILSEEGRKNWVENEKSGVCVTVYISTTLIAMEKRISNPESW